MYFYFDAANKLSIVLYLYGIMALVYMLYMAT